MLLLRHIDQGAEVMEQRFSNSKGNQLTAGEPWYLPEVPHGKFSKRVSGDYGR